MAVKFVLWCNCGCGGLQVDALAEYAMLAVAVREYSVLISFNLLLLLTACPPRHMGLVLVSHPLFLLLPPIVFALIAAVL